MTNERVDTAITDVRADVRAIGSELGRKLDKIITKFDIVIRRINNINNKIDFLTEKQQTMSNKINTLTKT